MGWVEGSIVIILCLAGVKWLIADWAQKTEKLEHEKEKAIATALEAVKETVSELKDGLSEFQDKVQQLEVQVAQLVEATSARSQELDKLMAGLQGFVSRTNARLIDVEGRR